MADSKQEGQQMATGRFPEDTRTLIKLLKAVDFRSSRLPREILEDLEPGKRASKMEYSTQVELIGKLESTQQRVRADTRPIDEKLMRLAVGLERYVRSGDEMSAQMAHAALKRGILDIRCNFPQDPNISQDDFVKINDKYLDQWINLVQWAEVYDRQTKGLEEQRRANEQTRDQLNQSIDTICARIEGEPDFAAAFFHILDHDSSADRANWTDAQRSVHLKLVEHRLNQKLLEMSNVSLTAQEQDQLSTRHNIESLKISLNKVPIVTDPNLMNKYQETMDQFIRDLAASDAFTEETLRQAGELEGALSQLEQTSAATRQRSAASEGARSTMDQLRRRSQTADLQ